MWTRGECGGLVCCPLIKRIHASSFYDPGKSKFKVGGATYQLLASAVCLLGTPGLRLLSG